MNAGQRLLRRFIGLVSLMGVPLLIFGSFTGIMFAWYAHATFPNSYNEIVSRWLGLGCGGYDFALSPEDQERVASLGFSPSAVANAEAGRLWCNRRFGANIDIGILLTIEQFESASGNNMGSCDWQSSIKQRWGHNPRQLRKELAAARWMMRHWRKHDVRDRNPIARAYIYEGYGGYISHCGAGEMGRGGWLPTTAKIVCQKYLKKSNDDEVRSCDFWSEKVSFHAIPAWLHAIGYRANLSRKEKIDALYCSWNCDFVYVGVLVNRAAEINALVGDVGVIGTGGSEDTVDWGMFDFLRKWIIDLLDALGLLPEVTGFLEAPFPEGFPIVVTGEWLEEREVEDEDGHKKIIIHYGGDFDCSTGDPIVALADGKIIKPSSGTLMDGITGFGKHIWIDHGGIYVVYAHLDKKAFLMIPGRKVKKGQKIGECGNTGDVYPKPSSENPDAGSHVHIGVSDQHPDDFVLYGEMNRGWMDPWLVLGTCAATTVK